MSLTRMVSEDEVTPTGSVGGKQECTTRQAYTRSTQEHAPCVRVVSTALTRACGQQVDAVALLTGFATRHLITVQWHKAGRLSLFSRGGFLL